MRELIRFIRAIIRKRNIERERHIRLSKWVVVGIHDATITWRSKHDFDIIDGETRYKYVLLENGYGKRDVKISWRGNHKFLSGEFFEETQAVHAKRHKFYVEIIFPWLHGSDEYDITNSSPPRDFKLTLVK